MNPCTRCNGSGTEPEQPSADQVRAYMTATGWAPGEPGRSGALWHHRDRNRSSIGVFYDMEPGSAELAGIISRLALAEGREHGAVLAAANAMEEP